MVNGLHLYSAFNPKLFTILPDIRPFMKHILTPTAVSTMHGDSLRGRAEGIELATGQPAPCPVITLPLCLAGVWAPVKKSVYFCLLSCLSPRNCLFASLRLCVCVCLCYFCQCVCVKIAQYPLLVVQVNRTSHYPPCEG